MKLARTVLPLAALLAIPSPSFAAFIIHYSVITTGDGMQTVWAPNTPISGTMTTTVPRFNPLLGTLTQADFEWAPNSNSSWTADTTPGSFVFALSGPADVGGQAMGSPLVTYSGTYATGGPSVSSGGAFANYSTNAGAFFTGLSSPGSETITWIYSGSSSMTTAAIGTFDWSGTAHVMYTYNPIPEPASLALLTPAAILLLRRKRR